MRLTLRTLLAYLDDLLDRRDAEELESKIQSSPLASELVHRIRNTVGQIRLDSPPVDGEGMGGDPNTVAEYLDNTLPPERVPDFERVCLDSDVNLGEVASCHQVLTLVLGEPAEVSPAMRRRVYGLSYEDDGDVDVLDEPRNASMGSTRLPVTAAESGDSAPSQQTEPHERVDSADERWKYPDDKPSYTAEKSFRVVPLALTAIAAFVLVFAGLRGLGPLDNTHPIARLLNGQQVASNQPNDAAGEEVPIVEMGDESAANGNDVDTIGSSATDLTADDTDSTAGLDADAVMPDPEPTEFQDTPPEGPTDGFDEGQEVALANNVADTDAGTDIATADSTISDSSLPESDSDPITNSDVRDLTLTNPSNPVIPPEPRPLGNPVENRIRNADGATVDLVPAFPGEVASSATEGGPIADANGFSDQPIAEPGLEGDAPAEPPFDPVMDDAQVGPAGPVELGRLMADGAVALLLNPNTQSWERPETNAILAAGDEYLSLPIYRSRLSFSNGVEVTLVGATNVQILPPKRNGVPRIQAKFGRFLVRPTNDQGLEIDLSIDGRETEVLFDDANSDLALNVRNEHLPGSDPTVAAAMTVVEAFATTGIVHWTEVAQEEIQISAGQRLAFVDDRIGAPADATALPAWINPGSTKRILTIAANRLAPKISYDRPAVISLQEQTDSKQREMRSLTACSLAYLGHIQPLANALNDAELKAYRTEQFETLRAIVSSGPEAATKVRESLAMRHGDRTDEVFRILWGYSPEELRSGAASALVEHLQDDALDVRIIAIETLKQIVGKSATTYGPEQASNSRRKAYLRWSADAKNGKIAYKTPPVIIELTK